MGRDTDDSLSNNSPPVTDQHNRIAGARKTTRAG